MAKAIDLTIANGATASNVLPEKLLESAQKVVIQAPASIGNASSITVQTSAIRPEDGTPVFANLQEGGSDVTLTANKARAIDIGGVGALRLLAGADPGANLVFGVNIQPWNW